MFTNVNASRLYGSTHHYLPNHSLTIVNKPRINRLLTAINSFSHGFTSYYYHYQAWSNIDQYHYQPPLFSIVNNYYNDDMQYVVMIINVFVHMMYIFPFSARQHKEPQKDTVNINLENLNTCESSLTMIHHFEPWWTVSTQHESSMYTIIDHAIDHGKQAVWTTNHQ